MAAAKAAPPAAGIRSRRGASRPRATRRASNKRTDSLIIRRREQGQVGWHVPSGKGPFVDGYLLNKADASRASGRNEIIQIWSRRSTILPQFVGLTFGVYNGHKFLPVQVNENMVGHKFGEFSPTRTFTGHCRRQEGEAGLR